CQMQVRKNNIDTFETAFIATCQNAAASTTSYTLSANLSSSGSAALAAYVFSPYNVVFQNIPNTGKILVNNTVVTTRSTIPIIGSGNIIAIPSNGFVFNYWQASNGNLTIGNIYSNNTTLTVNGDGSITAYYTKVLAPQNGKYTFSMNQNSSIYSFILKNNIPIQKVSVNLKKSLPFQVNAILQNSNAPPSGIGSPVTKVFNYTIINESWVGLDANISNVTYYVAVPVSWVSNSGQSDGNIKLYKYVGSSWITLPTTYTGTNGTDYFYTAVSNSLSTYAVGFSVNGINSTASSASLTLPAGYANYFYALGIVPYIKNAYPPVPLTNYINDSTATYSSRSAPNDYTNLASIGHSNSNTGSYSTTGTVSGASLVGVGANVLVQNGAVFSANTGTSSATSLSLSYSVATSNSFAIIMFSSAWYNFTNAPTTTASGCVLQKYLSYGGYVSAAELTCNSVAASSYTASVTAAGSGAISAVAYVFPPYNVILNNNPTTATITTNGNTYSNGQVMQVIGTNIITANSPTTGNWVFNSWSVSNSINLSISSSTANPATLTVMGNGIVTSTWNGITKFFETGLPTGAKWNVTYDGILNSSTTNMVLFSTLPGTYSFSVPVQKINGKAYEPSPSSGSIYSGNAITINFVPFSASITPPSNAVADAGQYETFTVTVYNGTSSYTYNVLVANAVTPGTIMHNDLVSGSTAKTLTYTFQTTSSDASNSPEKANAILTDSFPATVNTTYSSNFIINQAMTTPSISPTSPATYSSGQTVDFSTSFTGGSPPYTYNWLVVNSITGALIANALYTGVSATSNTFAWTIPSSATGNTVVANVIVTDSASTPVTVNSVESGVITISSVTCTISLSTTSINFGSISPSTSIATNNAIADSNTGNANAYIFVYGGNWIGPTQFGVSNTTWSKASGTLFSLANKLSSTAANTTILVPASSSNSIYFGLGVPGGAPPGSYSQNIIIENSC
ncbi:MAG: beta strand repeat-containing protein, partial [Candidatus Micrarchaeia archaeon]